MGTSFGTDRTADSSETFTDLLPNTPPGSIEVGLVRLKSGTDPEAVAQRLQAQLPSDVKVLTKQGFIDFEQNYWRTSTSIGFIFTLGAAMGFVVGCVIVYQCSIPMSAILAEYATLMAMGYKLPSLLGVVGRVCCGGLVFAGLRRRAGSISWSAQPRSPVFMDTSRAVSVFTMIW